MQGSRRANGTCTPDRKPKKPKGAAAVAVRPSKEPPYPEDTAHATTIAEAERSLRRRYSKDAYR